jgi:hypothetical protein
MEIVSWIEYQRDDYKSSRLTWRDNVTPTGRWLVQQVTKENGEHDDVLYIEVQWKVKRLFRKPKVYTEWAPEGRLSLYSRPYKNWQSK